MNFYLGAERIQAVLFPGNILPVVCGS